VDVVTEGGTCSRLHAAVVHHKDGRLYLIDLKSTHGSFINGERVAPYKPSKLKHGFELRLGGEGPEAVVFTVQIIGGPAGRPGPSEGTGERVGGGGGGSKRSGGVPDEADSNAAKRVAAEPKE
jgi:hypothetical protein